MDKRTLKLCIALFCLSQPAFGHLLDFGKCACSCRDEKDSEPFAGPKGETGSPGKRGSPGPPGPSGGGFGLSYPTSCKDLNKKGVRKDGVYSIKPSNFSSGFQVYCDMTTPGGPWTLVASVHENDFQSSCSVGDKWSSEQSYSGLNHSAGNWENTNVFGTIDSATSEDYKSPAYYLTQANNLMVWHVPNNTPADQFKATSTVGYKTKNNFLNKYGGNLRSFFKNHFQMKQLNKEETKFDISTILDAVKAKSLQITRHIPDWNNYIYDGNDNRKILDGGRDIFDSGNILSYKINNDNDYQDITYNEKYYRQHIQLQSWKMYPFSLLAWINNGVNNMIFKVKSELGADGAGSLTTYGPGFFFENGFKLTYVSQHVYNATDPSVMQVYFLVSNEQAWKSKVPELQIGKVWSATTDNLHNEVTLSGPAKNVLFGYTLLSKKKATKITQDELIALLGEFLRVISSTWPTVNRGRAAGCSLRNESVVVAVDYVKGNGLHLVSSMNSDLRSVVTPGFLHLRAAGEDGMPSALCPGYESRSCETSKLCVGGIQSSDKKQPCGDMANWKGSRTQQALSESLLIFYG